MIRKFRVPARWREMDQLQREMNRLFEGSSVKHTRGSHKYPAINLWANEEGQIIRAEMPGIKADDINIDVTSETLTISGSRAHDKAVENTRYHRQERGYGSFTRTLQLPFIIDTGSVEANFKNGVLDIKLQRAESDKPKKIAVKSE